MVCFYRAADLDALLIHNILWKPLSNTGLTQSMDDKRAFNHVLIQNRSDIFPANSRRLYDLRALILWT